MSTIVISYRREDVKGLAGRVFDRLEGHYGQGHVFMDIDSIRPGIDFRESIHQTLERCDILLAIVGPGWLGRDSAGNERIGHETDWVRLEIEAALGRKIPVIPLLVDRTPMPRPGDLPESMQSFAFRQAVDLDSGRDFRLHMDRLIRSMDQLFAEMKVRNKGDASDTQMTAAVSSPSANEVLVQSEESEPTEKRPPEASTSEPTGADRPSAGYATLAAILLPFIVIATVFFVGFIFYIVTSYL